MKIESIPINKEELYVLQFDCENTDLKKAAQIFQMVKEYLGEDAKLIMIPSLISFKTIPKNQIEEFRKDINTALDSVIQRWEFEQDVCNERLF